MCVDTKGDAHLSEAQQPAVGGLHAGIGIEHAYAAFIGKVYFRFVDDGGNDSAIQGYTGITHLKAGFAPFCLVLRLRTDRTADIGHPLGPAWLFVLGLRHGAEGEQREKQKGKDSFHRYSGYECCSLYGQGHGVSFMKCPGTHFCRDGPGASVVISNRSAAGVTAIRGISVRS